MSPIRSLRRINRHPAAAGAGVLVRAADKFVLRAGFALAVLLLALGAVLPAASSNAASIATAKFEILDILTASGPVSFRVEVAQSSEARAVGLMYRKNMAVNEGMLFDFEREQLIMMWMKNTFLPLDMMFIDKTGRILKIVSNTKPLSLDVIESGARVLAVLEVNGGLAARLGIRRGDLVRHRLFTKNGKDGGTERKP